MNEEIILKQLYSLNDWWTVNQVPKNKLEPFERRDFHYIKKQLAEPKILTLVGPRQVGKTTLMYQTINYLLNEWKVNPTNILFVSLDNEILKLNSTNVLEDILDVYFKNILKKPIKEAKEKVYLFLDEVQSLENWNFKLKNWFDQKLNLKIIISGSSSTNILTGGKESLAGRLNPQLILPLKFLELFRFKKTFNENFINQINLDLRACLKKAIEARNPTDFFNELKKIKLQLIPFEQKIEIQLNEYLLNGGYPGLLSIKNSVEVARALEAYVQATVYNDIVQLHSIRDPEKLNALLALIAQTGIHTVSHNELAKQLGIRSETVNDYLTYLKNAYLISESEYYSNNLRVKQRNNKKIYFLDTGIRNAVLHQINDGLLKDSQELGLIIETICCDHARRLIFNLPGFKNDNLSYWKDPAEIDIVLEGFKWNIPIEIKFSNEIKNETINLINSFVITNKCPFGLILTKNTFELKNNVILMPVWMFLLIC